MTIFVADVHLPDCDDRGPQRERVALAGAFIRHHIPEITHISNPWTGHITLRGDNENLLRVAASAVKSCGRTKNRLTNRLT